MTGRTNTSNDTNEPTGSPGSVNSGVASGPMTPWPWVEPGVHREVVERDGADRGEHLADHGVGALAGAAGRDDEVGAHELVLDGVDEPARVVGDDADAVRQRAGLLRLRGQDVRVGLEHLARLGVRAGLDERVAGREHDDARTRTHRRRASGRPRRAGRGGRRRSARRRAAAPRRSARRCPTARMPSPGAGRAADLDARDAAVGPRLGDDRLGAGRDRARRP